MFKFLIIFLIIWFMTNLLFVFSVRGLKKYRRQVITIKFNLFLETFELFEKQFKHLKKLVKWIKDQDQQMELQKLKTVVLKSVVNHLNTRLTHDIKLNITKPATTNGIDVWVYLATKLESDEESKLESYFSGVLAKYTSVFGLDILVIEQIAGAGWVAKFDVKSIEEATYNRMARQSSVENEEDF